MISAEEKDTTPEMAKNFKADLLSGVKNIVLGEMKEVKVEVSDLKVKVDAVETLSHQALKEVSDAKKLAEMHNQNLRQ